MADYTAGPNGSGGAFSASKYVNIAAAVVSVSLIGGVGVWGYKLLMRDVTGVPVVRAMQGDMRIAPENPGGEIATHVGLSVNSVPADGGAAEPEDRLVLAPSGVQLEAEDLEIAVVEPTAEAGEVAPIEETASVEPVQTTLETEDPLGTQVAEPVIDPSQPLSAEDVLALADQIAAGAAPMADLSEGETAPIEVAVNGVLVNPDIIPDAVPGVRQSLRPNVRPARAVAPVAPQPTASVTASTSEAATPITGEVTTTPIAVGTKLVQLGAFDSPDIAATEWVRFTARFPDFFDGKEQVIQQASSGGRTFFRLRAMGFDDLSDARRFCAALSAEGSDCIPVVVR